MENEKTKTLQNQTKYYKISIIMFLCLSVLSIGLVALCTINRMVTPLDENQQNVLQVKEEFLTSDFSNIYGMENVSCTLQESNWYVSIEEEDCQMIILYDKEYNLISKELVDNRLTTWQVLGIGMSVALVVCLALYFALLIMLPNKFMP